MSSVIETKYIQEDSNLRSYSGHQIEEGYFKECLSNEVFESLVDIETTDALKETLQALTSTGFNSDQLLADIQALESPEPQDLRTWRIGEAFSEVILENHFSCRFHWNELRDARNPKGNKTGADIVGFIEIDGDILFLFGEVKTSSETATEPPQVMTKKDGIENQLKNLYQNEASRKNLILYLQSKVAHLDSNHPFKQDFQNAIISYYQNNQYKLIGVLVRDVEPKESDVKISYEKIKRTILEPKGLKLLALYAPLKKEEWADIIKSSIK